MQDRWLAVFFFSNYAIIIISSFFLNFNFSIILLPTFNLSCLILIQFLITDILSLLNLVVMPRLWRSFFPYAVWLLLFHFILRWRRILRRYLWLNVMNSKLLLSMFVVHWITPTSSRFLSLKYMINSILRTLFIKLLP